MYVYIYIYIYINIYIYIYIYINLLKFYCNIMILMFTLLCSSRSVNYILSTIKRVVYFGSDSKHFKDLEALHLTKIVQSITRVVRKCNLMKSMTTSYLLFSSKEICKVTSAKKDIFQKCNL